MCDNQLSLEVSNVLLSADDLSYLLLVIDLTLVKSGLLDLYLLIENLKFLITLDKLCAQNITLINNHFVVLLLFLLFLLSFSDYKFETRNITLLSFYHVVTGSDLFLDLFNISIKSCVFFLVLLLLVSLSGNSVIFGLDLLFKLRYLLSHSLELHLELSNLLCGF